MSVHKSLVSKMAMARSRSVYSRAERLAILKKEGRLTSESHVLGLPKTKVVKALKKAAKEKKKDDAAAPAAGAAAPADKKGAAAAPAADKKAAKK